jgi:Ni/Co efflux regulator RcnB
MKHRAMVFAFMAIFLTTGESAFARNDKNDGDRQDRGRHAQAQRGNQYERHDRGWTYSRHAYRFDGRDERGAGPSHKFHRGERLPVEYNHKHYVVSDWRGHHLSAPPRGYHWVQAGGDYVLVAIATGIIVELLLNN